MIKKLLKAPTYWLNQEDCENLLQEFRDILSREESIPNFEDRFEGKLEGILGSVKQSWEGKFLNNTIAEAAASYFTQFISGHAFENGNKRLAVLYTHWFLLKNGITLTLTSGEMYYLAVTVAEITKDKKGHQFIKDKCIEIFKKYTKSL